MKLMTAFKIGMVKGVNLYTTVYLRMIGEGSVVQHLPIMVTVCLVVGGGMRGIKPCNGVGWFS
jgi:hypothetical protein